MIPTCGIIQPVSEGMRHEIVIGLEIRILDDPFFAEMSHLKRDGNLALKDSNFQSDIHFESNLLGNWL